MIDIYYHKKRKITVAQSFDELGSKQFLKLAPLIYRGGDEILLQIQALKILSGLSSFRLKLWSAERIDKCLPFVKWVYEGKRITKQLLPEYNGHYGPASDFDNLKMREFYKTESIYTAISKGVDAQEEEELLNNLVAVLYRPGKINYDRERDPDGDIRIEFNHNELPYYIKQIAPWPMAVKQAVFLWYDGCRENLIENNPIVFKTAVQSDFVSQFETGLYGVIRNLAGEKFGTIKEIEQWDVHHAMLELSLTKEEDLYLEQQRQKMKSGTA